MRLTKEQFVERAKLTHGDKYDYSKVEYKRNNIKVCIICPEHGEFWQNPYDHIKGFGCKKCSNELKSKNKQMSLDVFVEKAIKIHGNKYDYSNVIYNGNKKKVCIICPEHGEFWQIPNNHLSGNGCPMCKSEKIGKLFKKDINHFLCKSKEIHGDKYDYSKVVYRHCTDKVCIICPEHGEFWQTPSTHISGSGCPKCVNNVSYDKKEFIKRAIDVHDDKYDYSKVEYSKTDIKVCIICPEHGEFWQSPHSHLSGQGCPKCGIIKRINKKTSNTKVFIKRANEVHNNKYDYSKVNYEKYDIPVTIICPIHGEFQQTPSTHISGSDCPKCSHVSSKPEDEIVEYIETNHDVKCNKRVRNVIKPYELDVYIPSKQLAIEYDGLIWHSEKFNHDNYKHLYKTQKCNELGIELIHIFEDEWLEKREIVQNLISEKIGVYKYTINTDNYVVREISKTEAKEFFEINHIDGFHSSKYNFGLYENNEIISCITLMCMKNNNFVIKRFCNKLGFNVEKSLNILLSFISSIYKVNKFQYKHDMRFGHDNLFKQNGFKVLRIEKPEYYYIHNNKRFQRYSFKNNCFENNSKTLHENMFDKGYYRLYDCGREVLEANAEIFMLK